MASIGKSAAWKACLNAVESHAVDDEPVVARRLAGHSDAGIGRRRAQRAVIGQHSGSELRERGEIPTPDWQVFDMSGRKRPAQCRPRQFDGSAVTATCSSLARRQGLRSSCRCWFSVGRCRLSLTWQSLTSSNVAAYAPGAVQEPGMHHGRLPSWIERRLSRDCARKPWCLAESRDARLERFR